MCRANRLTIFDTTLRDGEQAPGFSLRIDEKLKLARQLAALGVDVIEAGLPDRLRGRRRSRAHGRRRTCRARSSPRSRAAARPTSSAPAGRSRRRRAAASTLHRHLRPAPRAQAAHVARGTASTPPSPPSSRARRYTDDVQFSAEDATRSDLDFLCRVVEAVIAAGCDDDQPARHGRLLDARRDRRVLHDDPDAACRTPTRPTFSAHCHDDLGLAVANTLAAVTRRRAPGRVHDQRHRRARRQRVARRDRDGDARPRPTACRSRHGIDTREIFPSSQLLTRAHRRERPGQQGHRRPQRVRARSRHPPGRHAEGSPHLRDHAARGRRRAAGDARARQALRPPRGAAPLRAARPHARAPGARPGLPRRHRASPTARRPSATATCRRSSRACAATSSVRHPPSVGHDFTSTPAESGYGHGV